MRGRSVVLKPNFVEFLDGHPINTQPPLIVAAANAMRSMGARSVVVAEGPGHRRDTEAVVEQAGLLEALDDGKLKFVDLNEAAVVRVPFAAGTRAFGSSGCRRSCATLTWSSRCRSSRPTTGSR